MTKKEWKNEKTIATYYCGSLWDGLEIKGLEGEKVIYYDSITKKVHRSQLHIINKHAYFIRQWNNKRVSLNDCIKTW